MSNKIRSIHLHSYLLSNFIAYELRLNSATLHMGDIIVTSNMATDWLQIAASVEKVEINMCKHDDSLAYCGTAFNLQDERSKVVASLATALTSFNFIWSAFEILCKCLPIPPLSKGLKAGRPSFVDQAQYYILQEFSSKTNHNVLFYEETLKALITKVEKLTDHNLEKTFETNPYTSKSGVGIQIVRAIRNLFAHGAVNPPLPEDHSVDVFIDSQVIELSSRIVLLTIQMLLLSSCFVPYNSEIGFLEEDYPFYEGTDWSYLYVLPANEQLIS